MRTQNCDNMTQQIAHHLRQPSLWRSRLRRQDGQRRQQKAARCRWLGPLAPPPPASALPTQTSTTPPHPHSAQTAVLPAPLEQSPTRTIAKHPPPHLRKKDHHPSKQSTSTSQQPPPPPKWPPRELAPMQPVESAHPLPSGDQRPPSSCAAAAHPTQGARTAYEAALQQAREAGFNIEEHDPQQPNLSKERYPPTTSTGPSLSTNSSSPGCGAILMKSSQQLTSVWSTAREIRTSASTWKRPHPTSSLVHSGSTRSTS